MILYADRRAPARRADMYAAPVAAAPAAAPLNLETVRRRATLDGALSAPAFRVYCVALYMLTPDSYTPLHTDGLARTLNVSRDTVLRALDELADAGYLEPGARAWRVRTFRLTSPGASSSRRALQG